MPQHAPKIFSLYGGGWTPEKKKRLEAVVLPEKSRCFECNKVKTTNTLFSEKQQNDLRHGLTSGQITSTLTRGWITCRNCVGIQKHEMQCIICERVKGLEDFAKAQRRDVDNARCKTCMTEQINTEPIEVDQHGEHGNNVDDGYDSEDSQSHIYGSTINDTEDLESNAGVELPDDLKADDLYQLNLSRDNSVKPDSKTSTAKSMAGTMPVPSQASTRGIQNWQTMSRQHGGENVKPGQFTAYDAQGHAHMKDISSTKSTVDDESDVTTHIPTPLQEKPGAKFAKIKPVQRSVAVPVTYEGRNVNYDSDDNDDDDGDDFFTV